MLTLSIDELLGYTMEERDKWRRFFGTNAQAIDTPYQPGGRCATVGKLIDHMFLIERRHLQRLRGESLAERTGLTGNNAPPLFDYGASVRRELEQYVRELDEDEAAQIRTFDIAGQQWTLSARKLLGHVVMHEIRHWAQIALAVRLAGLEPPGEHDLLYSRALR